MILNLQQNYSCYITLREAITWTQAVIPRCNSSVQSLKPSPLILSDLHSGFSDASIRGCLKKISLKITEFPGITSYVWNVDKLHKLHIILVSGLFWKSNQSERLDYQPIFITFTMVHSFKRLQKTKITLLHDR